MGVPNAELIKTRVFDPLSAPAQERPSRLGQNLTLWQRLTASLRAAFSMAMNAFTSVVIRLLRVTSRNDGTARLVSTPTIAKVIAASVRLKPRWTATRG